MDTKHTLLIQLVFPILLPSLILNKIKFVKVIKYVMLMTLCFLIIHVIVKCLNI